MSGVEVGGEEEKQNVNEQERVGNGAVVEGATINSI